MAIKTNTSTSASQYHHGKFFPIIWLIIILLVIGAAFCWSWRDQWMAVSACSTGELKLTAGQQEGAAGTIYQHMDLTNTGTRTCTIAGYPTAFLYGSDGYAIGNGAAARPQPVPVVITLAPNQTANTVLGYPQAGNFNPGVCSSQKSTSLKLYPPSSVTALEVPLEINWCPGFSESAMQAGS